MVKMMRIPLAAMMLLLIVGGGASAQIPPGIECTNDYLDCGDVSESSVDTVRLVSFDGRPGDTVWLPVYLKTKDDTVSGFSMIIEYSDTYLTPVKASTNPADSLYIKYELMGGLLEAQQRYWDSHPNDSPDVFTAAISQNPFDEGAITCGFNLSTFDKPERIFPGGEIIFRLAFEVDEAMQEGQTAQFRWWEINEYSIIDTGQMIAYCADCRRTNLSVDRTTTFQVCVDSSINRIDTIDTGPPVITDTIWQCDEYADTTIIVNRTRNPTTRDGQFTANLSPPPVIASFTSSDPDDSVGTNQGFVLQWTVDNTDSVVIYQDANVLHTSVQSNGFFAATSPSTAGTYTYTLWAFNPYDSVSRSIDILVQDGDEPPPDEHAPVINVNTSFSIDVGNTLNFTVNATDVDNDFLTLTATNLPAGATFPSAQGTGSASSTFSWTPGFNQTGSHTATFRAEDATSRVTTVNVTINVNEPEFDKLFTSSVEGSAAGGLPGKTNIDFPINLVTSQTVYGVQFDFLYSSQNFTVTGVDVTDNTAEYVVYENIGQTPGEVRFVTFGMANEPIGTDGTEILLVKMAVRSNASPGLYPIYLEDAWESINPDPSIPSLPLMSDSGIIMVDAYGDVNLDTRIDVADLVSIVGYIIGDFPLDPRRYEVADMVVDGVVDVFDLVAVINSIYGAPIDAAPPQFIEDRFASVELDYAAMAGGLSDELTIRSEMPVDIAGVQLEILYDPGVVQLGVPELTEDVPHLALRSRDDGNGRMTILMYSSNPFAADKIIRAGRSDLVNIPIRTIRRLDVGDRSQLVLNQAKLATENAMAVKVHGMDAPLPTSFHLAQNYPNPFNPTTTIEFTLGAPGQTGAQRVDLNVYNILGQQVKELISGTLPAGNHQVTWDGTDGAGKQVASGIYLYRLQVGDASQAKKMLLLK